METSLFDLPAGILIEILSRLPLGSLFLARCVCKTFLHLTSSNDPHFVSRFSANADPLLVFQFATPYTLNDVPSLPRNTHRPAIENSIFKFPKIFCGEYEYKFVNSCHGLLYLVRETRFKILDMIVCNPVTNECLVIPGMNHEHPRALNTWLGFSRDSDRYKILKLVWSNGKGYAKVLTVGSDSWRDVTDVVPVMYHYGHTMLKCLHFAVSDEIICWLSVEQDSVDFFDFEKEEFGAIKRPKIHQRAYGCRQSLAVLQSCLCLSYFFTSPMQMVVWKLKNNENNTKSWSKEFVIDMTGFRQDNDFMLPVQIFRNGEVLMASTYCVVYYDPKNQKARRAMFQPLGHVIVPVTCDDLTPTFIPLKDALKVDGNKVILCKTMRIIRYASAKLVDTSELW